jgi:hypothetical protein
MKRILSMSTDYGYFVGALIAHFRAGSRNLVGWAVFFVASVAALVLNLAH